MQEQLLLAIFEGLGQVSIKIIVATHKKYKMPNNSMYIPVQVGRENKEDLGYIGDNSGENISLKNPNYCELTAVYWAWKNLKADFIGLVHYRRHFCDQSFFVGSTKTKWNNILSHDSAKNLLNQYDVILPKKRHYWIETSKSHYEHAHNGQDLLQTRKIIEEKYPDYIKDFDEQMNKTASHRFNMFIMKERLFHNYCEWMFDILFQLEKDIDISNYSPKEARVFGYISERLLDVWLSKNCVNYVEVPVMFMEKQNWAKKIFEFLKRKVLN
ncbi:MAG: exopolysaccharide biosynthesis protein [Neobacillus sp.]|nr:exopolysaccharide biosynthesis protein [Neobacillus sp.]